MPSDIQPRQTTRVGIETGQDTLAGNVVGPH
jgi:hypothetical protein